MSQSKWRSAAVAVLAVSVLNLGMISAAQAGIVSTSAIVRTDRELNLAAIRSTLDRGEVRAQMEKMGVDAAVVDARMAALSDSEMQDMATQMQSAPAGGNGALVVVGIVFVVLMILEFTGVIDIFKRA
jgi:uncharacterized membrane protein (Fun14 family)